MHFPSSPFGTKSHPSGHWRPVCIWHTYGLLFEHNFKRFYNGLIPISGKKLVYRWKSCLTRPVHIVFIIFFLNNSTCMSRPVALLSFRSTENPVHIIWCSRCYPFHLRWSWLWIDIGHSNECWPWSIFTCSYIVIDLLCMPCSKGLLLTLTMYFDEITSLLLTVTLLSVFYSSH